MGRAGLLAALPGGVPPREKGQQVNRITEATQARNVIGLVKGEERYLFVYTDDRRVDLLRKFAAFALDPGLSFTWLDAANCSREVRRQHEEKTA